MKNYKQVLGKCGEDFACEYLKKNKYKILERNYKNKFGEIDIIASFKNAVVFFEVKTRFSAKFGKPYEAVNFYKQKKITTAAKLYLVKNGQYYSDVRFDVIEIYGAFTDGKFEAEQINHIENAIEYVKQF